MNNTIDIPDNRQYIIINNTYLDKQYFFYFNMYLINIPFLF